MESNEYLRPAGLHRIELVVAKSRFITHVNQAHSAEDARRFIHNIGETMRDASHHVYAFRVGYGNSVIEGMSDAGEPSGTAGPPTLSVLRGTDIGDIVLVTTRYFGGTKLGTGGLVRAYTESAQLALSELSTELKVEMSSIGLDIPYSFYTPLRRLLVNYEAIIDDEVFEVQVSMIIRILTKHIDTFEAEINDLTNGLVSLILLDK